MHAAIIQGMHETLLEIELLIMVGACVDRTKTYQNHELRRATERRWKAPVVRTTSLGTYNILNKLVGESVNIVNCFVACRCLCHHPA